MAGQELIDAYRTALTRRLPTPTVDELVDGLTETYLHLLHGGLDPGEAALAAVSEFGTPDLVVTAFVCQGPGRRSARVLLTSGPVVGAAWGAALLTGPTWVRVIPAGVRVS